MKKIFALIIVLTTTISFIVAGPFGLEMGWDIDQVKESGAVILDSYDSNDGTIAYAINPPKKHSSFSSYIVLISDKYGLYQISAESDSIYTAGNGYQIKSEFYSIYDQLVKSYGDGILIDKLAEGSIWDEPEDWMMGLKTLDRTLSAIWLGPDINTDKQIALLSLDAEAEYSDTGRISISYFSDNAFTIEQEKEAQEASVL